METATLADRVNGGIVVVEAGAWPLSPTLDSRSCRGEGGAKALAGRAVGEQGGVEVNPTLEPVSVGVARRFGPEASVDGGVEGRAKFPPVG